MSDLNREEAIEALKVHVREFIEMELTSKLDERIDRLARSGALSLDKWDGDHLGMPRAVTTALMEAAADRVIGEHYRKKYQRQINKVKTFV